MKGKALQIISCVVVTTIFTACQSDNDSYSDASEESLLERRLIDLYGSTSELVLPDASDFSAIPSDIDNPITQAKVTLGKFLYHETGLALNSKTSEGMFTYSCASCHHADAGFQSGIRQGIGRWWTGIWNSWRRSN